jgi:hypothetical protein
MICFNRSSQCRVSEAARVDEHQNRPLAALVEWRGRLHVMPMSSLAPGAGWQAKGHSRVSHSCCALGYVQALWLSQRWAKNGGPLCHLNVHHYSL